jgi:hypothetical protein
LGTPLADALVATALSAPDGVLAVTTLLQNHNAEIGADTMERILDVAPRFAAWHGPLVERPSLSGGIIRRLAKFVSRALLGVLNTRKDADPETVAAVTVTAERRLAEEAPEPEVETLVPVEDADDDDADIDAPVGEPAITAAIEADNRAAVVAALARDADLPRAVVRKILASASAKAITALAWKAKYSMPLATRLQSGPGGIAEGDLLRARDDDAFPLSEAELEWQLELFPVQNEPVRNRRAAG